MEKANTRLKELRLKSRKSQREIASLLGISQGAYSQIESGNSSFSMEQAIYLSREYNVTIDWLATGEGRKNRLNFRDGFIPLINSQAHAGYIHHGGEKIMDELELFRIPGFTSGEFRIFEVEGNSMRPTILPDDYLICSKLPEPYNFVDGTICTVVTTEEIFVKRIYTDPNSSKRVIFKCDNTSFPDQTVSLKIIKELWTVNAKLTTTFFTVNNQDQENRIRDLENKLTSLENKLSRIIS